MCLYTYYSNIDSCIVHGSGILDITYGFFYMSRDDL